MAAASPFSLHLKIRSNMHACMWHTQMYRTSTLNDILLSSLPLQHVTSVHKQQTYETMEYKE